MIRGGPRGAANESDAPARAGSPGPDRRRGGHPGVCRGPGPISEIPWGRPSPRDTGWSTATTDRLRRRLGHDRGDFPTGGGSGASLAGDPTDGREHRPAHRQRPVRGAAAALEVRSREPHVQPGSGPAAGGLRGGDAGLEVLRRPGPLRRAAAGQPHPAARPGVARGGLSRRHRDDPAAAPALARSRGLGGAPVLLLPARGDRDADLADRGAGRRAPGHRGPGRRRALRAALRQDGHRLGQDARHGHGHRLARPQPGGEPSGLALLEARARGGAGAHREEPPRGARAVRPRQLLRPVQHGARRRCASGCARGGCWCATGTPSTGRATSSSRGSAAWTSAAPRATTPTSSEVLGEMASASNLLVINDEAHHAWRVPAGSKLARRGEGRHRGGHALDRRARPHPPQPGHPRLPTTSRRRRSRPPARRAREEALFGWIVSDFGLNDAIESGLVKTPRVVVRDDGVPDAKTYRSKLYHIYQWVRDDLNRKAEAARAAARSRHQRLLPARQGLAGDGPRAGREAGMPTPPVMITVANRTETAARVHHAFDHGKIRIDELCGAERTAPHRLEGAREGRGAGRSGDRRRDGRRRRRRERRARSGPARKLTKEEQAERLRVQVDTVGQPGKPGERIQNVISVGMLTEGWDAKTVTHIMGLRAFSSQLLCEQVVGRGLRRTVLRGGSRHGPLRARVREHLRRPVHVPAARGRRRRRPAAAGAEVADRAGAPSKRQFEITWPNVRARRAHVCGAAPGARLGERAAARARRVATPATLAELAPVVEGKPDVSRITEIDLEELAPPLPHADDRLRDGARRVRPDGSPTGPGSREVLLAQLVRAGRALPRLRSRGDHPRRCSTRTPRRRRILLTLNMNRIVRHLWEAIRHENTQALDAGVRQRAARSAARATCCPGTRAGRGPTPSARTSTAASSTARGRRARPSRSTVTRDVDAWVKNDHLGFEIVYVFDGVVRKYRPDFLVRLADRHHARPGGQGPGLPAEPGQARRAGRVDARGDGARRLRPLAMGGVENAIRHRGPRPRGGAVTARGYARLSRFRNRGIHVFTATQRCVHVRRRANSQGGSL